MPDRPRSGSGSGVSRRCSTGWLLQATAWSWVRCAGRDADGAGSARGCAGTGSPRETSSHQGVPVLLVEGSDGDDQVPVPGRAAALASAVASVRYMTRRNATHLLPLVDGQRCAMLIAEHLDGTISQGGIANRAGVR